MPGVLSWAGERKFRGLLGNYIPSKNAARITFYDRYTLIYRGGSRIVERRGHKAINYSARTNARAARSG